MTEAGKKILVIDDDFGILRVLAKVLGDSGYQVVTASDGQDGLKLLFDHRPDLVLLDVVMPRMDGWQTCERIRDLSDVPIIILTGGRVDEDDIARGLEYGADDYLIKPVGNKELVARVRAALRRAQLSGRAAKDGVTFNDGYLTADLLKRQITVDGRRIKLTPREFRLFTMLLENSGNIITHQQILERVWGWEYSDDIDYVRIYISHLRQKIERDPARPKYITTESGVGYCFQAPV
jgi:two-component system, OmpR family, KDP operon response regulator KdpE